MKRQRPHDGIAQASKRRWFLHTRLRNHNLVPRFVLPPAFLESSILTKLLELPTALIRKRRRAAQPTLQPRQSPPSRQQMLQPQSAKAIPRAAPPPRDSELSNTLAQHRDRGTG
eukprot:9443711-Pyramimonas_sp.AAC.1